MTRGGALVLDVPSFHLGEEELVALIGPNGSGKSSLLLTLMGLLPRDAGRLLFRGREPRGEAEHVALRRRMAMVLQEPMLFDASVADNVAAGLRLRGIGRAETRERVHAFLERFRLTRLADRAARKLSGGEARRVCLARALVTEPEVVLLDEPFAGLDVPTRQAITEDLARVLREARVAAVLVTHDQGEALRLSSRVVVMQAGRILQSAPPAVVMNEPANEFVASCVGMETVVAGTVRWSGRGEVVIEVAGRELDGLSDARPGEAVYCGIRPENVVIDTAEPGPSTSARNVLPATIAAVSAMGAYLVLRLDCGFPLVAHVTGESFASLGLVEGGRVFAAVKATAIHVIRRVGPDPATAAAPAPPAVASRGTCAALSRA